MPNATKVYEGFSYKISQLVKRNIRQHMCMRSWQKTRGNYESFGQRKKMGYCTVGVRLLVGATSSRFKRIAQATDTIFVSLLH